MTLTDLSDARRALKSTLGEDDRDVTNERVKEDENGLPVCVLHGAMNRVHPTEQYWRCSEWHCGVGAQIV
jgi:hypothetical protein